jgi:hypothetical protein
MRREKLLGNKNAKKESPAKNGVYLALTDEQIVKLNKIQKTGKRSKQAAIRDLIDSYHIDGE